MANKEFIVQFGSRVARRRQEVGLTQEELAAKIGYKDKSSINKIEKGLVDVPQSRISDFAKALNTTEEYLMGWESNALTEQEMVLIELFRQLDYVSQCRIVNEISDKLEAKKENPLLSALQIG